MSVDTIQAALAIIVLGLGLGAAIEDIRMHRLRDGWSLAILGVTLVGVGAISVVDDTGLPLDDLLLGGLAYAGIPLALHLWSPADIGFGDVKYSAALGAFLGTLHGPLVIIWGLVLAALGTLLLPRSLANTEDRRAFGPGLFTGALVLVLLRATVG